MANYSDLIKVTFEDATSYGSIVGDDILGVVINHHWGPVNEVKVLDRASFFENYPESLPVGAEKVKVEDYYSYAQVKKAFELGVSKVEVYRPQGEWKYIQAALVLNTNGNFTEVYEFSGIEDVSQYTAYNFPPGAAFTSEGVKFLTGASLEGGKFCTVGTVVYSSEEYKNVYVTDDEVYQNYNKSDSSAIKFVDTTSGKSYYRGTNKGTLEVFKGIHELFLTESDVQFTTPVSDGSKVSIITSLKYPGFVPKSLLGGDYDSLKISYSPGVEVGDIIVSLIGVKGNDITIIESVEGSVNPSKVVDGNSYFIESRLEKSRFLRCKVFDTEIPSEQLTIQLPLYTEDTASDLSVCDVENVMNNLYSDIEQSQCTFLISPYSNGDLDSLISNIASKRMNVNAIIGYPISETFDKNSIESFHSKLIKDKFSIFVAARETITVLGQKITSSCVGGWCGATAKIARDVRLNQMASARTYGTYSGLLCESLKFEDVLTLHEKGICSIYKAFTGPQIFGIRTLHPRQSSYFGKANVSRVLASILRNIFPIAIDAIHTDAASNPITRASLSTQINFVIDSFISKQNLKDGSFADLSDEINTDLLTQGGKYLNIILSLRFIGLVESVNIKVIATDSSVTAEIV